jgi:hypothetical protein
LFAIADTDGNSIRIRQRLFEQARNCSMSSGKEGDDALPDQEKEVRNAIREVMK